MTSVCDQQHQLEERISSLTGDVQRRIDEAVQQLTKKMEGQQEAVHELTKRMEGQYREGRQSDTDKNARIEKKMEEKVDALIDTVKTRIDIGSSVGEVVASKLNEDKEEEDEIRRRRTNIIIHGVVESPDDSVEGRVKDDMGMINDLLHDLGCDGTYVVSAIRLGKRQEGPAMAGTGSDSTATPAAPDHPRPLKLVMATEKQQEQVLKMTKNLQNKMRWKNVFLHQDLTPKQREKRHQLVRELKRRREVGESNILIVNNRIVTRRARGDDGQKKD